MKKIIVGLLLVTTIALSVAGAAFAATNEERICELAKSNEKVLDAQCVIYQRTCLIAIKTEKFTTRSEYDEYLNNLCEQIKGDFEVDHVVVTRNPKVMAKLTKLCALKEEERNKAIEEIIEKEMNRREPSHGNMNLPRFFGDNR